MTKEYIIKYVLNTYPGMIVNQNWGETGIFYNPEHKLQKGVYILTFKEKDGANDNSSKLNREGIYRLNLGISKTTFCSLFGKIPKRPAAGKTIDIDYNFTQLNQILPHPVYCWMSWICVLNPDEQTFEKLKPLIDEGYQQAVEKYQKRNV